MKTTLILSAIALTLVITGCDKEEEPMVESSMFKVSIENVMDEKDFLSSGVFNTPVGATEPGGAGPGNMYSFSFEAGPGTKLSFATMFVASNDLYYAPSGMGIELFDGSMALSGDITSQIMLYDAGTEVNEEPGTGPNQPMNGGPGVGMAEDGVVKEISMVDDGFSYPMVSENIKVSIENDGATGFTVSIKNMEGSSTPIAPGVWVVHTMDNPLFEEGMADFGSGLKGLAEDGNPSSLAGH
ncbi:MAG: spondin domain-containing protein, partial [Bacteroides sp.]|nr:spondin domain-containing protein [Bacteroides sp.]